MTHRFYSICTLVVVLVAVIGRAEQPTSAPAVVGVDDLLEISVMDLIMPGQATTVRQRVQPDGGIGVPVIGRFEIMGVSLADAGGKIDEAYRQAHLVRNAAARVQRIESGQDAPARSGPLGAGDVIHLVVADLTAAGSEDSWDLTVSSDGTVNVSHVGQVKVAGSNDHEAAQNIIRAFRRAKVMPNAIVSVLRIKAGEPK